MKTYCPPAPIVSEIPKTALIHRSGRFLSRFLPLVAGALLVPLCLASNASAAGADGTYHFSSASGSLVIDGQAFPISTQSLGNFGILKYGKTTIKDNKLPIYRSNASSLVKELAKQLGATIDMDISGPTGIRLKKSDGRYIGSSSEPLVVSFRGKYDGEGFSGNIKYSFKAVVDGDKLIVNVPVSGHIDSMKVSGHIKISCVK